MKHVLHLIPILSPFLFIPSLYASILKSVAFFIYLSPPVFILYTQCKSLSGVSPYKNTYNYVLIDIECLRLVLIMEMLRCTCVQISPLWFTSLRREKVVENCLRPYFVDGCHGNAKIHMRTKFHFDVLHGLQV